MKRLIEYRTFYLITKILVISFILLTLIGCLKSNPKEQEYVDTLVAESPIIDTITLGTVAEKDSTYEIKKDTILIKESKIKEYVPNNSNDIQFTEVRDSMDNDLKHKILMRKKYEEEQYSKNKMRIEKIEMVVDSASNKWDEIEKAVKKFDK